MGSSDNSRHPDILKYFTQIVLGLGGSSLFSFRIKPSFLSSFSFFFVYLFTFIFCFEAECGWKNNNILDEYIFIVVFFLNKTF